MKIYGDFYTRVFFRFKNLFVRERKLTEKQENLLKEFFRLTEDFEKNFGKRKRLKSTNFERRLIVVLSLSFILSLGIVVNIYFVADVVNDVLWFVMPFMLISVSVLVGLGTFIMVRADDIKRIYEGLIIAKMKFAEKEAEFEKIKRVTDDLVISIPTCSLLIISVMFFSSLVLTLLKDPPKSVLYAIGFVTVLSFIYGVFRSAKSVINFKRTVDNFIDNFKKEYKTELKGPDQKVN